jgi:hypothetical protein
MLLLNPKTFIGEIPSGWYALVSAATAEENEKLVGITPSPVEAGKCLHEYPGLKLMRKDKEGNLVYV